MNSLLKFSPRSLSSRSAVHFPAMLTPAPKVGGAVGSVDSAVELRAAGGSNFAESDVVPGNILAYCRRVSAHTARSSLNSLPPMCRVMCFMCSPSACPHRPKLDMPLHGLRAKKAQDLGRPVASTHCTVWPTVARSNDLSERQALYSNVVSEWAPSPLGLEATRLAVVGTRGGRRGGT